MGVVFVNYRAKDNPLGAAGIHHMLARRFGGDRVFRDCVSMAAGDHYPSKLREGLERADVLVAVIGPRWNELTDEQGRLLIQRDRDWVRCEIARAIVRGIHIVPVLLRDTPDDATPPDPAILPESISKLVECQTFEVSQRRFGADLDRLADRLVALVPSLATPPIVVDGPVMPGPRDRSWIAAIHTTAADSTPVGAGVVLDERRILTSAHLPRLTGHDRSPLWVAFPFVESEEIPPKIPSSASGWLQRRRQIWPCWTSDHRCPLEWSRRRCGVRRPAHWRDAGGGRSGIRQGPEASRPQG